MVGLGQERVLGMEFAAPRQGSKGNAGNPCRLRAEGESRRLEAQDAPTAFRVGGEPPEPPSRLTDDIPSGDENGAAVDPAAAWPDVAVGRPGVPQNCSGNNGCGYRQVDGLCAGAGTGGAADAGFYGNQRPFRFPNGSLPAGVRPGSQLSSNGVGPC